MTNSTFAWYQSTVTGTAVVGTRSDTLQTKIGVANGLEISINFTIGTVTAPELSDANGDVKYSVNDTLYDGDDSKGVGQYAIKVSASDGDLTKWKNAVLGNSKSTATATFSLTGVDNSAENADISTVLLKTGSVKAANADKSTDNQHSIVLTFTASTKALVVTSINGAAGAATTKVNGSDDTTYTTSANALFGVRPKYEAAATNFDTLTEYTDTTNAKYWVVAAVSTVEA